jgi:hypothetical protein
VSEEHNQIGAKMDAGRASRSFRARTAAAFVKRMPSGRSQAALATTPRGGPEIATPGGEALSATERAFNSIVEVKRPIRPELSPDTFTATIPRLVIAVVVLGLLFAIGVTIYSHFFGSTYSPEPFR